jgi:hypothetical protein
MIAYERSTRRAFFPSVACSGTTVPPVNGLLSSNEAITDTNGPSSSAGSTVSSSPQA